MLIYAFILTENSLSHHRFIYYTMFKQEPLTTDKFSCKTAVTYDRSKLRQRIFYFSCLKASGNANTSSGWKCSWLVCVNTAEMLLLALPRLYVWPPVSTKQFRVPSDVVS